MTANVDGPVAPLRGYLFCQKAAPLDVTEILSYTFTQIHKSVTEASEWQ